MADYVRREKMICRVEYALPARTVWGEVGKLMAALRAELTPEQAQWDDAVDIHVEGDEIVFSYEKEITTRHV